MSGEAVIATGLPVLPPHFAPGDYGEEDALVLYRAGRSARTTCSRRGPASPEPARGVGATLGFPVGRLEGAGSFTYFFPSDFDYWKIDVMALYPLPLDDSPIVPYVAAGLAIGSFSVG